MVKNHRFKASIRVYIGDKLLCSSMVITKGFGSDNPDEILQNTEDTLAEHMGKIGKKLTDTELRECADNLKRFDGWSDRKIRNHFKKYGIDIEQVLSKQKKLI